MICFLVERGHREEDIVYRYSLPKILAYYEAAAQNFKVSMRADANCMRAAFGADKSQFKDFLDGLE